MTQEGNRTLSAILLSIAFPCMVLSSVSAPGERDDMLLVWSLIAGVVLFTALPVLSWVLIKVTRIGGNEDALQTATAGEASYREEKPRRKGLLSRLFGD